MGHQAAYTVIKELDWIFKKWLSQTASPHKKYKSSNFIKTVIFQPDSVLAPNDLINIKSQMMCV